MLPATIDVQTARNPFESNRVNSYAIEGETIETIIMAQGLRLDGVYTVNAVINGELVPERMFAKVRPKAGTLVVLRVIPRGGNVGKGILSIVLGIIIIAASWGALTPLVVIAAGAAFYSGIQSILAPPPAVLFSGDIPESQNSPALSGTSNSARLYGPIRTVLGKYRVYPDLLGKPFIETVGNDSILRMLLCFGYGPLDITDIRIGEMPIMELISSSDYNVLQGWDDDEPLTIFRDEVDFDGTIKSELPRETPEVANLTTKPGPEEISFDIVFPGGLIAFDKNGKPQPVTVRLSIQEKETGGGFLPIGDPTGGVDDNRTLTGITKFATGVFDIKLQERGSVTRGFRWTVPLGSTVGVVHHVKVTRVLTLTSVSDSKQIVSDAVITGIRTIKPHIESKIKNLAKIELKINASDTGLSGVIGNLSAICTSIAPKFDSLTQSWGPAKASSAAYNASMFPTRNAAWLFAQVLRGPANSRPIEDSRIDGPGLGNWAGNLEGTGNEPISGTIDVPRNLDAVIDYKTTTRKVLSDIAGASRSALNLVDGKYGVVQDIPRDQIIQHFSPRNSRNFSGAKAFRRRPHAIRTHFVNPQPVDPGPLSYQKDERIVYDDGYSEDGDHVVDLAFRGSTTPTTLLEGGPGASTAWVPSGFSDLVGYQGYAMRQTITGAFPHFQNQTDNLLAIDADESKFVRVKMRRVTAGNEDWYGKLNFRSGVLDLATFQEVQNTEPDWTKGWITVVWDLSENADWTGTIDRLRFSFTQNGSDFPGSVFDIESIVVDNDTKRAEEFAELSLWGVADSEQAFRDARYHLASTKLRPEVFTIEVDVEHLVCNRGDLVRVSHDVIGVGFGGARFTDVTTNAQKQFLGGTLDEEFVYKDDKSYAIRIRGLTPNSEEPANIMVNIANQGSLNSPSSRVSIEDPFSFSDDLPILVPPISAAEIRNNGDNNFAGMLGYVFQSSSVLVINVLGVWDGPNVIGGDPGLGLEEETQIGIWESDSGDLLRSTTVGSGTSGLLIDGFRYGAIDEIELSADVDYTVGALYNSNGGNAFLDGHNAFPSNTGITCTESRYSSDGGSTFTEPTIVPGGFEHFRYVGPNVGFTGSANVEPRIGDLVLFGERNIESLECIIQRISPRNDLTAVIEMVEYNEAVYEPGPIPMFDSKISLQANPALLRPINPEFVGDPISDETVIAFTSAGAPESRIVINVITPQNAIGTYSPTTHYHTQFRGKSDDVAVTSWYNVHRVEALGNTRIVIYPVEEGETYDIRVRAISDQSATASEWIYKSNHTVIGLSTPPDPPTELSVWGNAIRWSYGEKPQDFAGFIVKHQAGTDATWSTGIVLSENLITDNWVQIGGRIQPGNTTLMVRAVDIGGNESTTLSAVKLIASPDELDVISSRTWTGDWDAVKTNCQVDVATGYLIADENSSPLFWHGSDASTYWAGDDAIDFWGLTIYDEMSYEDFFNVIHDPDDTVTSLEGFEVWPGDAHIPGKQRFSEFEAEGADFKVEYRAIDYIYTEPLPIPHNIYVWVQEWTPWPGERTMHELEYPWYTQGGSPRNYLIEKIYFRITISGGATQGKLKAAKMVIEGLPKVHRETVDVLSTGGTVIDITSATTGKLWRKITSATVTAVQDADASQGGITGEVYNLLAKHEPGGTGTGAWELSGPKIRLWTADATGTIETTGNAVVVIEGY